eukprot:15850-Heterococcus_DN1.PRE.2
MNPLHAIEHVVLSILFLVWLLLAAVFEIVKYLLLLLWAIVAWVITSTMTLHNSFTKPLYWDWHKINLDELSFPPNFMWGVATAAHQVEGGCDNNNWHKWEHTERPDHLPPTVKGNQKSGVACDHWNKLDEDTELVKRLGVGCYRFSIEWSKIEPSQGTIDAAAVAHYHQEIDILLRQGIMPMTLTVMAMIVAAATGRIAVCTANSYVTGLFPPGKFAALRLAGKVLKRGSVISYSISRSSDFLEQADSHKRAPAANDFVGLNYYSHYYVNLWNVITNPDIEGKLLAMPHETMTDMPHCMYPEGLYTALQEMATIGHPIIVTENGCADADDTRRQLYIRRYIYAMSRAIQDGVDVIGYFYWCLYDNYEWCEAYNMRFGLYKVDFDTQERTLRAGANAYISIVSQYSNGLLKSIARPEAAAKKYQNGSGMSTATKELQRRGSAVMDAATAEQTRAATELSQSMLPTQTV